MATAAILDEPAPCILLPADRGVLENRDDLMLKDILRPDPRRGSLSRRRERFSTLAARLALAFAGDKLADPTGALRRMWKVLEKYFPELPRPVATAGLSLRLELGGWKRHGE